MAEKIKICMAGSEGRMGKSIIELSQKSPFQESLEVTQKIDQHNEGEIEEAISSAQATIEFAHHGLTSRILSASQKKNQPVIIGTTGHSSDEKKAISAAAESLPIVFASNFSVGVNTLFHITEIVAGLIGKDFDQEIVEMHHHHKKDAPSGTARTLGEILAKVKGLSYDEVIQNGREGDIGERKKNEIGMHSLRGGDVVGDHTVMFAGNGERIELTHRAGSRNTFASGALHAALWAVGKEAGLYDMRDVLGLKN